MAEDTSLEHPKLDVCGCFFGTGSVVCVQGLSDNSIVVGRETALDSFHLVKCDISGKVLFSTRKMKKRPVDFAEVVSCGKACLAVCFT